MDTPPGKDPGIFSLARYLPFLAAAKHSAAYLQVNAITSR